ncbi:PD-(D/E)XK nuclease family protein [Siccibacter turicensis]|uniref:PDDEXK-like family protein n=1 Tax=Siccibacter turicensis TaxID=357233 RepID=UPI0023F397FC|nr:PD-(D/E)XK nuclease family protein [Siccibacter turicensis]
MNQTLSAVPPAILRLLHHTSSLQEGYRQAERRYYSQIAPDFRPFSLFTVNENTLSRCLAFLLNPQETHGQGSLFLDAFYRLIDSPRRDETAKSFRVYTEYCLPSQRRIDIVLMDNQGMIGIENKPWAADQPRQLYDYACWLEETATRSQRGWHLIYLCNNEIDAATLPLDTPEALHSKVLPVTFYQLESWLSACAVHVKALQVRCFVEALAHFIREEINGETTMELQNDLTDAVLASPQSLSAAMLISQNIRQVKTRLWNDFLAYVAQRLEPFGIHVEQDPGLADGRRWSGFRLMFGVNDALLLRWEFEASNFTGLAWGICATDKPEARLHAARFTTIAQAMNSLFPEYHGTTEPTGWWPWWAFSDSTLDVPRNWTQEPDAWVQLLDRDSDSFAEKVVAIATRIHQQMDLTLFHPLPLKA